MQTHNINVNVKNKIILDDLLTVYVYPNHITSDKMQELKEFSDDIKFYFRHNMKRRQIAIIDLKQFEYNEQNISFSINERFICK